MKPVRRMDSSSQSCSCTSCIYKSESEQPSIRKYVAHGSRISRLYFGKYIPLRERKLLTRLARTRAVYDDLRARLISDSTLSLEQKADLRPGRHQRVVKPVDSQKSGAILEIIDIIDKGEALGPKQLSDCCSCCSCSSEILRHEEKIKRGKEEHGVAGQIGTGEGVFAREHQRKHGKTGQTGMRKEVYEKRHVKTGQTGTGEGEYATYETYERDFGKKVPGAMEQRYNKRGVRFKAKHIRSEPCTCTFKFSGLIKKHSKAMLRKTQPAPLVEPLLNTDQQIMVKKAKKSFARKSVQKYKEIRDKLDQDMKKLNESKENLKKSLQLRAKKSLEQSKKMKKKIKQNIETGVRKSMQVVKALHPKEVVEPIEYPNVEPEFKIKKDSIVKFKDYLKKKEMMKDWECDLECEPDVCVPEECFKVIKLRRSHKRRRQHDRKLAAGNEVVNKEMKIGGIPLSTSSSGVQTKQMAITTATHIRRKKQKPMLRDISKNQVMEKRIIIETKRVHKVSGKKGVSENINKSGKSVVIVSPEEKVGHDIEKKDFIKSKSGKERGLIVKKPPSRGRQAVRIKSSFSFDIEFYKNRPEDKLSRSKLSQSSQPSGIHMHAPKRKHKRVHRRHESKSSVASSQGTPQTLKTRLIQTDKYGKAAITSVCECPREGEPVSKVSNVKTNTNYGAKSVSSSTKNVATTDKNVSKEIKQKGHLSQVSLLPARPNILPSPIKENYSHHKQAVRIGSTFSFDIEFYKQGQEIPTEVFKDIKSPLSQRTLKPIKEKLRSIRSKQVQVKRKLVQVKGTSAKAYKNAKNTLQRCFCTLKLNKHNEPKKETNKKEPRPPMIDKFVETKKKYRNELPTLHDLLPYECEPGICIPDECDPILCKKILDLRQQKFKRKSIGSHTDSRKTKSTSSILSRPLTSAKTVQSIVSTKVGGTGAPRRYKNNVNTRRKELVKTTLKASDRQAVRIGSSFSFNIEFYKNDPSLALRVAKKPSMSSMPPEIYYKYQKVEKQRKVNDKRDKSIFTQATNDKSMFTQVMNVDKHIGPSLKNCLCLLKLRKNKIPRTKHVQKLTADTQTLEEAPIRDSVDRGTKTKRKHLYKLLPYECEPYTCVPGECDPYICLQNIKRRELNTRNKGAFTDKPDMRSMSSITEDSFTKSEAISVQPKLFPKGTNMKANYFRGSESRPRSIGENFDKASKSKQAVRVGSSFKFSIEFSKQSPGPGMVTKYPKIKQSSKVYQNNNTDRGITVTKVRVNHGDTQSLEPRKVNRASLVRPMLKRCFCTLNLEKKIKQQYRKPDNFGPRVYTIGRATTMKTEIISQSFGSQTKAKLQPIEPKTKILSISTSSFLLNKYVKSLKSKYETVKVYSTFNILNQPTEPAIKKSSLSMKINIIRQVSPYEKSWAHFIKHPSDTLSPAHINKESYEYSKLFNESFQQNLRKMTGISRYLERCFCTMNVQISNAGTIPVMNKINHKLKPYECEPGICIPGECDPHECKKLIMKRFAKHVHKSSGTKSKSISSYTTSHAGSDSKRTQMHKHIRNHSRATVSQKYKHTPKLHIHEQRDNTHKQAVRIKSSFSFDLEFYKHRPLERRVSQKTYRTVNKSMQRDIHKIPGKDRQSQSTVGTLYKSTGSTTKRCFCTLKLQKKGRIHEQYAKLNSISPKQLPSITSRSVRIGTKNPTNLVYLKESGINTVQKEMNSGSSMTSEEKYKSHATGATPVTTRHKSTKSIKYIENIHNDNGSPSVRSVVRIGSNFNFNIEFFKDMPGELHYKETNLQKRSEIKANPSQIKKSISHKLTVTEIPLNEDASTTPHHHTAQVHKSTNSKTFKNRCFCVLGLLKKDKHAIEKLEQRSNNKTTTTTTRLDKYSKGDRTSDFSIKTAETPTNTKGKHKVHSHHLEPYECEPGICVPGQCDPYHCEKMIQKRLAKQQSKKLETDTIRRNSASSGSGYYRGIKNERTQSQGPTRRKTIQHHYNDIAPSSSKTFHDKNVVRIGSNFSFNIEFYKENVNGSVAKAENIREVKTYPNKDVQHHERLLGTVSKISGTKTTSAQSKKSQITTKTKTLGINPLLKRCFCTLRLMNKSTKKIDQTDHQLDAKPIIVTKTVETQSYKPSKGQILLHDLNRDNLSPYECEPFVCIPGQCDPVECLKRIKKRQQHTKESSTITKYPKRKSMGSVGTKMRNENSQVKYLTTPSHKHVQKTSYVEKSWPDKSYNQSRQAVRIGSNFSFNIEFYKERGETQPTILKHNVDAQGISPRLKSTEMTTSQRNKICKHRNTSVQSDRPKTAHSNVGTLFRKCMCTLKLNKAGKQLNVPPTPTVTYEIKGTSTQRPSALKYDTNKSVRLLEPFECEPYVCVPGECDPYECLKRIQRRQVRDFGTDYKRHVRNSGINCLRKPLTRSTKAQYHHGRKFDSKGTSSISRRTRRSEEKAQLSYDSPPNTNRQVVRIGSNFSFNIEIFKDRVIGNTEQNDLKPEIASNMEKIQLKRPEKLSKKSKGSMRLRSRCDKKSQCSNIKRQIQSSTANIEHRRHSKSEDRHTSPTIPTKTKTTVTKFKYTVPQELGVYECPPLMCIPGECNPYECLEKIKKREIMRKSRNVGTRTLRTSIASVQNRGLTLRTNKAQSQVTKRRNVVASTAFSEPQSEIFKSNRQNKCAVRIGSNFNFNVEFFKQKLQPAVAPVSMIVKARHNREDSKSYLSKNFTAGTRNFGHSYMNKTNIKDQGSDAGNSLKRCFCTLQLQKHTNQKSRRMKMHHPGSNARHPQTFTVGRVTVEPFCHAAKMYKCKKANKAKTTCTDPKLLYKTVGTKTNKKYLDITSQCNCHDYQKKLSHGKFENDMQTILPFSPSKFRKESKACISAKRNLKNNCALSQSNGKHGHKPIEPLMECMDGRRLTAKKSKKSIPIKSLEGKADDKNTFFCRCIRFFSRSSKAICEGPDKLDNRNTIKQRITDQRTTPGKLKLTIGPKKAKSFGDDCPFICQKDTIGTDKRYSYLQSGDVNCTTMQSPKTITNKSKNEGGGKCVTFADNTLLGSKTNKSVHSKSDTQARLCYYCSVNDCLLQKSGPPIEICEKFTKNVKNSPSYPESADDCQYCSCCKTKVNANEIFKASGDTRSIIVLPYKDDIDPCPCGKDSVTVDKERRHSLSKKSKKSLKEDTCPCGKDSASPRKERSHSLSKKSKASLKSDKKSIKLVDDKAKCTLEMRLNHGSLSIINKSEVKKQMEQIYGYKEVQKKSIKTKSKASCICCKCKDKNKKTPPPPTLPSPPPPGGGDPPPAKITDTKKKAAGKPSQKAGPCVCGSTKCAVHSLRKKYCLKLQKGNAKRPKICICGSDVCAEERKKIKKKHDDMIKKTNLKIRFARNEQERKAIELRVKKEEEADAISRNERINRNKKKEHEIHHYRDASDVLLAVDSIIDIGQLGLSSLAGGVRYTSKAFTDPKVTYEKLAKKYRGKDAMKQLEADYKDSDVAATLRRIRMRFCFMKKVQTLKEVLEGNPFTHFILHIADKNAKTRKFKRKPVKRFREPLDFQCSLYMASLRKRPHLAVYMKWPRFYPHLLSILNIWKQFTDIMLFLLAAVVWSPCILCMEGCRALMCCFFCTG